MPFEPFPKTLNNIALRVNIAYNMYVLSQDEINREKEKTDERTNKLRFNTIDIYWCFELGLNRYLWF